MNERECINAVLKEIVERINDITDKITINPDDFYKSKIYVRYSNVISIINEYREEQE